MVRNFRRLAVGAAVATRQGEMTTRVRRISGKGALYDGKTKILAVAYLIQLHEQAVPECSGGTRFRICDFSVTVGSEPDYDIYPYVGMLVTLRLQDGKQIAGAIVSMNGDFFTSGPLLGGEFEEVALR